MRSLREIPGFPLPGIDISPNEYPALWAALEREIKRNQRLRTIAFVQALVITLLFVAWLWRWE